MDLLNSVAMIDRYSKAEQKVGFLFVEDHECRETRGFDIDQNYIVFYNGDDSIPSILKVGKDKFDVQAILMELNVAIVKGRPTWGQRGMTAVFEHHQSALIYMIPEQSDKQDMIKDWRLMLMFRMIKMMQEQHTGFIPLIAPFLQTTPGGMQVPQLSAVVVAKKEDLPNFYVIHPLTQQIIPFPEPIDDIAKFSPDLVLLWARKQVLELEVEHFEKEIVKIESSNANPASPLTDKATRRFNQLNDSLNSAKEEQSAVIERYENEEAQLAEGKNKFADDIAKNKSDA